MRVLVEQHYLRVERDGPGKKIEPSNDSSNDDNDLGVDHFNFTNHKIQPYKEKVWSYTWGTGGEMSVGYVSK